MHILVFKRKDKPEKSFKIHIITYHTYIVEEELDHDITEEFSSVDRVDNDFNRDGDSKLFKLRTDFPETWLWEIHNILSDGLDFF